MEVRAEQLDAAAAPELSLDGARLGLDRPRPVRNGLVGPDPLEEDAQAPVEEPVAQEEEVGAPQLGGDRDGKASGDSALGEIRDVVVLADDEALELPCGRAIDLAVDLQDTVRSPIGIDAYVFARGSSAAPGRAARA